jgi:hypothetical protein
MRPMILMLIGIPAFVAAAPAPTPQRIPSPPTALQPREKCVDLGLHWTGRSAASGPSRLGDQPSGNLYSSVLREVDGCKEAVLLRQGLGLPASGPGRGRQPASRRQP